MAVAVSSLALARPKLFPNTPLLSRTSARASIKWAAQATQTTAPACSVTGSGFDGNHCRVCGAHFVLHHVWPPCHRSPATRTPEECANPGEDHASNLSPDTLGPRVGTHVWKKAPSPGSEYMALSAHRAPKLLLSTNGNRSYALTTVAAAEHAKNLLLNMVACYARNPVRNEHRWCH